MTSLQTIISLSSIAVDAYASGENECAATRLMEALRLIPSVYSKSNTWQSTDTEVVEDAAKASECSEHHQLYHQCHSFAYCVHPRFVASQNTLNTLSMISDYHHGCMYRGAFVISTEFTPNEVTATMLYNLALVVHSEGMKRIRSSALFRAMNFYSQALGFLTATDYTRFSAPSIHVLIAAILTNMSHIANENFEASYFANEAIVDHLIQLTSFMESESSIRHEDTKFFQHAMTLISITNLDLSPAA